MNEEAGEQMTQKHYLAAGKRLKQGEHGSNSIWMRAEDIDDYMLENAYFKQMHEIKGEKYWRICQTKKDHSSIVIERRKECYIPHIANAFLYELECEDDGAAYEALFRFVDEQLDDGDKIEMYTCWDGEENAARLEACDTLILLGAGSYQSGGASFPISRENPIADLARKFRWCDRQYVVIQR